MKVGIVCPSACRFRFLSLGLSPEGTNEMVDNHSNVAGRFELVSNPKTPNERLQHPLANQGGGERYFKPIIIIFGLALIFFSAPMTSFAQVTKVQHVLLVLEENTDYADVCGPNNASMPFLCSLKSQGSFSANYYAPTHPSIGNYDDLGWGVVTTNDDSCIPNTCGFPYSGNNIVRELQAASQTWKGYAESLSSTCYFGGDSGQYAVRHSPIPYISDVQSNCLSRYVAFEDRNLGFAHDLANNTLPNYAFITPNLCDDAHDCTLPGSPIPDQWLQNNVVQPLLNSGHVNPTTGDTVLIVTFDESNTDNTNGGGRVYWFMMGTGVKQNYQSTGPSVSPGFYSHESTLRVIAEMLGASFGGLGGAANAPDMAEFFGTSSNPPPTAGVSPMSLTFGGQTVGSASAAQTVTLSNTGSVALTITSIAGSGDFAETNTCGSFLAAGGNCTISVTFTPTASGTRTGTLSITDNASGSPQSVSLTGTGSSTTRDFSLAASPTSGTITAGQSATFTLNVSPSGGFNQTVSLACSGAPQAGTCTISPSSVTLNGSSASKATLTVTTTTRGMLVVRPEPRWIFPGLPALGERMELTKILWLMATLALLGLLADRRRQARLVLGFAVLLVVLASGCPGMVKSTPPTGTPAGNYTLTLTGTSGTGSSALTHSIKVTLAVN
jgi:Phosphoesterase family/Abnormal spindle-like microcephaly-assoc'd, ASPM-SPD-2-Hydin